MAQNKGTIPVKDGIRGKKKSRFFVYFWIITTLPISLLFLLVISQLFADLPSIEDLKDPQYSASILYANDGKTEIGRYWKINRVVAKYDSISPFIKDALISTEDERFYSHSGIDVKAIGRAVFSAGSSGGASTITQQLAKQLFTLKNRQDREIKIQNGESDSPKFGKLGRIFTRIFEKLRENIISTRIEIYFTKEEIITMYLNQFDFLYNAVGITNACRTYFGKLPNAVTKEEAAMLVGMCKNPGLFNPHTFSVKNYKAIIAEKKAIPINQVSKLDISIAREKDSLRALNRRNQVLFQWKKNSLSKNKHIISPISEAEYQEIIKKPLATNYQQINTKENRASYFRDGVRRELTKLLDEIDSDGNYKIYKYNASDPEDKSRHFNIYEDGLRIYTTLDYRMQVHAENALKRHLKENLQPAFDRNNRGLRNFPFSNTISTSVVNEIMNTAIKRSDRYYNAQLAGLKEDQILASFRVKVPMKIFTWNGEKEVIMSPYDSILHYKSYLQAGLVSIEPQTGFVKAWVGGADINHFAYDHVGLGKRQIGSTIKPFVYATGMSMGVIKPCSEFSNIQYCINLYDAEGRYTNKWCPKGGGGGGSVTVKRALAQSMNNISAAIINRLGQNGPKTLAKILSQMEIQLEEKVITPSMCLGSMDMSLYELVAAQATFVNHGLFNRPTTILRIEDRHGNEIYSATPITKEIYNETYAYSIIDMMKEVVNSGTGGSLRGGQSWGGIRYPTAGKTGTTQSNSDGWFIGLTPELATGIWVGAEDRSVRFTTMDWGQGARLALPIYGYMMQKVYADSKIKLSKGEFIKPDNFDDSKLNCSENYNYVDKDKDEKPETSEDIELEEELDI